MKKLTVITTGGTIASVLKEGVFSVQEKGREIDCAIQDTAEALGYAVDILSPINKNSESITPVDWLTILAAIDQACVTDVDGVVVLHGTDTMPYTLAAAGCFSWAKRVCFTGAMIPSECADSDASINLRAAMSFAVDSTYAHGAYLAFRSHGDNLSASILYAHEVKPLAFDEDCFHSLYNNVVAHYTEPGGLQGSNIDKHTCFPCLGEFVLPSQAELVASQQQLAYIKLYPGIDLPTLQVVSQGRAVVVIELYHSGTGPASVDYGDLLRLLEASTDKPFFALSAFPCKTIQYPYASTQALIQAGGHVYGDLQPHCLYVLCLLMIAQGKQANEIKVQLSAYQL